MTFCRGRPIPEAAYLFLTTYIRIDGKKGSFSRRTSEGKGSTAFFNRIGGVGSRSDRLFIVDMMTTAIGFFGDIWADMIRHRISRPRR